MVMSSLYFVLICFSIEFTENIFHHQGNSIRNMCILLKVDTEFVQIFSKKKKWEPKFVEMCRVKLENGKVIIWMLCRRQWIACAVRRMIRPKRFGPSLERQSIVSVPICLRLSQAQAIWQQEIFGCNVMCENDEFCTVYLLIRAKTPSINFSLIGDCKWTAFAAFDLRDF